MGDRTVYDDAQLQQLEQQHKGAIPIIYCAKDGKGSKGWTGFVVSKTPMIIITVSHGVRGFNNNLLKSRLTFFVKFYEDFNYYPAIALRWDHKADILVLTCKQPCFDFKPFSFVDPDLPFLTSKSLFSISHAGDRNWRVIRGSICSQTFLRGELHYYSDSILFDHDVQLYPGGSGAPLIDLMGRVCGIQNSEIATKEHVFSVTERYRRKIEDYTAEDVACISRQISELTFRPTNLKQATPVQDLAKRLKLMFLKEEVDPHTGLDEFLRESVNIYLLREIYDGAPDHPPPSPATSHTQDPQPSSPSPKRPRQALFGERVPRVLSLTDRAAAARQFLQPPWSDGYSENHEKLAQRLWSHKQFVTRAVLVPATNGVNIPVATAKGAPEEDKSLSPGNEPLVLWQPEECEGGDNDLATITVNPLFVQFLRPHQSLRKTLPSMTLPYTLLRQEFGKNPVVSSINSFAIPPSDIQPEDCEGGDNDLVTVGVDPLIAELFGPRKRNFKRDPSTLAAVPCKCQILLSRTQLSDEFACSLCSKAGSSGLNMIGGSRLVLFDPRWYPANGKQAAARVWRGGLKDRANFYRFLSTGFTEEKVYQHQVLTKGIKKLSTRSKQILRTRVGMVDEIPDCYGEQDEIRNEMVALSEDVDGAADTFGMDVDDNGLDTVDGMSID